MLRPLNDNVIVEPLKAPASSLAGVLLTEDAGRKYHGMRALVVAVGPGVLTLDGARVPINLSPGDVVVLRSPGPLVRHGGRVYSVVSERDVLAVAEGEEVSRYAPHEYAGVG